ncbi:MAG: glutathione S-transferase family protein [Myxococcaceae bacterium]|nr:glutathione S-transferase family protein [Myxococcaceae bacterium]
MKLFYVPRTRANRPRWLLEELGVPYELVRLDPTKGETRTDEHTARHPLKHVPVLETADGALFESAAIVLHLADLHGKLIPPVGSRERGLVYQWLFFAMTELEPHAAVSFAEKVIKKTPDSELALKAKVKLNEGAQVVNSQLEARDFILPSGFSVADIVLGSVVWWANRMGAIEHAPHVQRYLERLTARPAYQRAVAD